MEPVKEWRLVVPLWSAGSRSRRVSLALLAARLGRALRPTRECLLSSAVSPFLPVAAFSFCRLHLLLIYLLLKFSLFDFSSCVRVCVIYSSVAVTVFITNPVFLLAIPSMSGFLFVFITTHVSLLAIASMSVFIC